MRRNNNQQVKQIRRQQKLQTLKKEYNKLKTAFLYSPESQ
jgi:hypothetical protein